MKTFSFKIGCNQTRDMHPRIIVKPYHLFLRSNGLNLSCDETSLYLFPDEVDKLSSVWIHGCTFIEISVTPIALFLQQEYRKLKVNNTCFATMIVCNL